MATEGVHDRTKSKSLMATEGVLDRMKSKSRLQLKIIHNRMKSKARWRLTVSTIGRKGGRKGASLSKVDDERIISPTVCVRQDSPQNFRLSFARYSQSHCQGSMAESILAADSPFSSCIFEKTITAKAIQH
ncbi:hypothetical protein RND71_019444 [Anisodus tanguticus]|uniref:Uncharacterized protein n=1 Tax=Anisodus tanguticus TaxID=243964 RepID=A0AAE1RZG3_9SOLA|nr:hypothetical protein RND71_019444 [Anisodus tanguticus]